MRRSGWLLCYWIRPFVQITNFIPQHKRHYAIRYLAYYMIEIYCIRMFWVYTGFQDNLPKRTGIYGSTNQGRQTHNTLCTAQRFVTSRCCYSSFEIQIFSRQNNEHTVLGYRRDIITEDIVVINLNECEYNFECLRI